ncbi:MAG TPA: hypothetical protein PKY29_03445 [Ferruginibacter sp.]|nr:hypothetical protein [Ferruginibacter sp.]HRO17675.1 hypothetical protein [Ferruginibacter sp.]HRQ20339.1 hypothetical protein [Ferruginibacter sp.]
MKTILIVLAFLATAISASAQATLITIDHNKLPTAAVSNTYPQPVQIVTTAVESKMASYKVKPKKIKGYTVYQGVIVPEISAQPLDLYFKVEQPSKRDKNSGTVTLLISGGNEVFYNEREQADMFAAGQSFLNNLTSDVTSSKLAFDLQRQNKEVQSTNKKLDGYKKELSKLQRQKKDIESKIARTEKSIADTEASLKSAEQSRDELKSQVE